MKKHKLKSYKFCEFCGKQCVEKPREHEYDKFTGKQLLWLICPDYKKTDEVKIIRTEHSRWVKELVTNIKE